MPFVRDTYGRDTGRSIPSIDALSFDYGAHRSKPQMQSLPKGVLEGFLARLLGGLQGGQRNSNSRSMPSFGVGGPSSSMGEPGGLEGLLTGPLGNVPPAHIPGHVFQKDNDSPEMSPVQVALSQLDQLINQGSQLPAGPSQQDLQQALNESAAGLRKQYGAQIGAIQSQNAGARSDVRTGSNQVRKMYNALGRSYNKMGHRQFKQGSKLAHQLQNMGKREGDIVTSQANDINEASLRGAAGLGLADLGSELTQKTSDRAQRLSSSAVQRGTLAGRAEKQIAGNDRTFMQTSGQASRLEGTNTAADMYADLQDYLQANRSQIASLAGERAAAIAQAKAAIQSSFSDAQSDYADMQMGSQQDLIDNKMALLKLALEVQSDQHEGRQSSNANDRLEKFYDMLPDQIAGPSRLLSQMKDPTVTDLYEQLSGTSPMRYGYTGQKQDDTDVPLVDNLANVQNFVRSRIGNDAWGSMSTAQRNALVSALLLQLQGLG